MKRALINTSLALGVIAFLGGCSTLLMAKLGSMEVGVAQAREVAESALQVAQTAENIGVPYAGEAAAGIGLAAILLTMFQRYLIQRSETDLKAVHARVSSLKAELKATLKNGNGGTT